MSRPPPSVSRQVVASHHHGQGFSSSHRRGQVVASSHRLMAGREWPSSSSSASRPPPSVSRQVVAGHHHGQGFSSSHCLMGGLERQSSSSSQRHGLLPASRQVVANQSTTEKKMTDLPYPLCLSLDHHATAGNLDPADRGAPSAWRTWQLIFSVVLEDPVAWRICTLMSIAIVLRLTKIEAM